MATPWQVVVFFERLLERQTGVRPDLLTGPERGKNLKFAKRLLEAAPDDWQQLLEEWAENQWEVRNHPSLTRPCSMVNELRFKLAQKSPVKSYARTKRSSDKRYAR